jgi:hypothetical protein
VCDIGSGCSFTGVAQCSDGWRCCWQKEVLPTGGDVVDKEEERSKITLKYKQAKKLSYTVCKRLITL